jgi:hypothetical protein
MIDSLCPATSFPSCMHAPHRSGASRCHDLIVRPESQTWRRTEPARNVCKLNGYTTRPTRGDWQPRPYTPVIYSARSTALFSGRSITHTLRSISRRPPASKNNLSMFLKTDPHSWMQRSRGVRVNIRELEAGLARGASPTDDDGDSVVRADRQTGISCADAPSRGRPAEQGPRPRPKAAAPPEPRSADCWPPSCRR